MRQFLLPKWMATELLTLLLAMLCPLAAQATTASVTHFSISDEERIDSVKAAEFNQVLLDALHGDAQAQYIVGYRYYYGRGIDPDASKAIAFLSRAVAQEHQAASELLKQVLDKANGGDRTRFTAAELETIDSISASSTRNDDVHISAEVMPCYPGGLNELVRFLSTNIQYPEEARQRKIEGRVLLRIVIDKTGNVEDVMVMQPVDDLLDQEAVRVCKMLPRFEPGVVNGKAVRVWYTLPISFKLTD